MLEFLRDIDVLRERILREKKLTPSELSLLVKKKQDEFAGLLNEAAAIYAIAREMGIAPEERPFEVAYEKIAHLSEGSQDVNLLCRVRHIYALKTFERNGRKGSVVNMVVEDDTGAIKLVLWNREAELVEKGALEKGDVVEIRNAYVKKSLTGIELHLGMTGSVRRSEKRLEHVVEHRLLKIGQLTADMQEVDVVARVLELGTMTEFERKGRKSQVASILVGDESGVVRLVLWDAHANLLEKLRVNDVIKVENGYVRKGLGGALELHLGWMGRVLLNPKNAEIAGRREILKIPLLRISELRTGEPVELKVTLKEITEAKSVSVCRQCGEEGAGVPCPKCGSSDIRMRHAIRARLADETGELEASLFGKSARKLVGIRNLADDIQLSTVVELKKGELLGKEMFLLGRLVEEKETKRKEFLVESVVS